MLGRARSGVGTGVGVDIFSPESELESESLKIRLLRSPALNDTGGLQTDGEELWPTQIIWSTREALWSTQESSGETFD